MGRGISVTGQVGPEGGDDLLAEVDHVVLGDERHLDVELGELRLPVGPEVLVAVAAGDLVVALHAADHQQLLEQLRRLRQRVPAAGLQPHRDQEVAGALRRGPGQRRGLDLQEVPLVQHGAGQLVGPRAQSHRRRRTTAAQVEVAVLEPDVVAGGHLVVHRQRQRRRLGEHVQLGRGHLDLAGGQLRVLVALGPAGHLADDLDAVLVAQRVRVLLAEHHLDHAGAVPQVDEDDPAVVAPAGHPPGQRHRAAGVRRAQAAGVMGTDHGVCLPHLLHGCLPAFCPPPLPGCKEGPPVNACGRGRAPSWHPNPRDVVRAAGGGIRRPAGGGKC